MSDTQTKIDPNDEIYKIISEDENEDDDLFKVRRTLTLIGGGFATVVAVAVIAVVYTKFKNRHL